MRLIKMLGLAAMAAMVATAFIGASTASATTESIVLCEKAELECEEAEQYPNPTEIHAVAENTKLKTNIGTVICEESLARLTLLNELAKSVEGHLLELTFEKEEGKEECKFKEEIPCTVKAIELGGLSFEASITLLADVTTVPLEEKETKVSVKCGIFISCNYTSKEKETELIAHSDEQGHLLLLAVEAKLKSGGFGCPTVAEWTATYHAIELDEALTLKTELWIEG